MGAGLDVKNTLETGTGGRWLIRALRSSRSQAERYAGGVEVGCPEEAGLKPALRKMGNGGVGVNGVARALARYAHHTSWLGERGRFRAY